MFNLESSISAWRNQMLDAGIRAPVPLDELESHLRDDIAQQIESGIDSQTAFETAAKIIGEAPMLKNEFKKNRRSSALAEKLMLAVALLGGAFIICLCGLAVFYCYSDWDDRVMAAVPMACTLLVAWGWTRLVPHLPVIANTRKRVTFSIACVAFGLIASGFFCSFILPRFQAGADHQIPAVGFWAGFLIVSFACLGLALAMNERERARLGSAISWHLAARTKNAMLSFAGIPSRYLSMNNQSFNLDSRSATYLRSTIFLLPAAILWMLAATYVVPQFRALWLASGSHPSSGFDQFLALHFDLMYLFKDNLFYLGGFVLLALGLLEWRVAKWPRYRRAVLGAGVFVTNFVVLFSFAFMFLAATFAATQLHSHIGK